MVTTHCIRTESSGLNRFEKYLQIELISVSLSHARNLCMVPLYTPVTYKKALKTWWEINSQPKRNVIYKKVITAIKSYYKVKNNLLYYHIKQFMKHLFFYYTTFHWSWLWKQRKNRKKIFFTYIIYATIYRLTYF